MGGVMLGDTGGLEGNEFRGVAGVGLCKWFDDDW